MAPARRGPRAGAAAAPDSRRLPRPPPASPAGGSGRAGADGGGPRGVDGRGARRFPGAPRWGPPQRSPTPPGSGSPRQRSPTPPGSDALCSWNMFYGAAASNQAIPAGGDTSDTAKVTDTAGLFNGASAFNKDISSWAVGSVTAHQQLQHVCQISLCMFAKSVYVCYCLSRVCHVFVMCLSCEVSS